MFDVDWSLDDLFSIEKMFSIIRSVTFGRYKKRKYNDDLTIMVKVTLTMKLCPGIGYFRCYDRLLGTSDTVLKVQCMLFCTHSVGYLFPFEGTRAILHLTILSQSCDYNVRKQRLKYIKLLGFLAQTTYRL